MYLLGRRKLLRKRIEDQDKKYRSLILHIVDALKQNIALHRYIKVRHRYIFTKTNKVRLRYIVGTTAIASLALTSFLGSMGSSIAFSPVRMDVASVEQKSAPEGNAGVKLASIPSDEKHTAPVQVQEPHDASEERASVPSSLISSDQPAEALKAVELDTDLDAQDDREIAMALTQDSLDMAKPRDEILKISPGDTVAGALQNAGVSGADAYRAIKAMSKHYDPRLVRPGQSISVSMEEREGGQTDLTSLRMKLDPIKELVISRDENDRFVPELQEKKVVKEMKAAKARIQTSLYGSAARAGIPASVVAEMIRIYSYEVDFQRDIRQGDTVEIFYETYETEDGDFARYGDILYANLKVGGHSIPVFRYDNGEDVDYYRENGLSLKRTLMQTPVDGARISSGYGMRHHPVLGYNKMHKGVDFAAPRGTPIYAAGTGTVEKASRYGGYGNYVRIRHKGGLKTAYAHMQKFAKGVRSGTRVKQGQVIGYIGTTGRSTGPHLHFEVLKNNKQVNPKSIKSAASAKLAGAELKKFQNAISSVKQKYASMADGLKFAQNNITE